MAQSATRYCMNELRKHDRDRYVTLLFAPDASRGELAALYNFNLEISRIPYLTKEPMLAEIRLQWWRDAVAHLFDGEPEHHPVFDVLAPAMARRKFSRIFFENLIDCRQREIKGNGFESLDRLERYAEGCSASLLILALEALGVGEDEAARRAAMNVGTAWALVTMVRSQPRMSQYRKVNLPQDLMGKYGIDPEDIIQGRIDEPARNAFGEMLRLAERHLENARSLTRQVPKVARSPLMLAALADQYIKQLWKQNGNPFKRLPELPPMIRPLCLLTKSVRGAY